MRIGPFKIHWGMGEVISSEIKAHTSTIHYPNHEVEYYYHNPIRGMYGLSYLGCWFVGIIRCGKQYPSLMTRKKPKLNQSETDASQD